MIGSFLCFVLYPLSRYFTSRLSGGSKKSLSPAVINGTAAWDGDPVATRFTKSQTTLLDQWEKTKEETKERIKQQNMQEDSNTKPTMKKEQLDADLFEDIRNNAALKMSDVDFLSQEKVEALKQMNGKMAKQNKEGEITSPSDTNNPDNIFVEQVKCLQIDDSIEKNTCQIQGQIQTLEEIESPLEKSTQERICAVQKQTQALASVTPHNDDVNNGSAEEQTPDKTGSQATECWDEYEPLIVDETPGGMSSSEIFFSSLLTNTEICRKPDEQHNRQTGWHFPAGPGLAQEVQCPLWRFPAASYYPQMESAMPFEVIWRVWEELEDVTAEAEPVLIPFPFKKTSIDFTIMSYNILSQDLLELNHHLYKHCPPEFLDWNYRCNLLLEEIEKWAPDIICLQEVQKNHYHDQLHPVFSQMGYTCVYKRRTGTKTDGCAICYRSSCFSEVTVTKLEFFRPETELLDRHNVGIVLLLRPVVAHAAEVNQRSPPLCVANTHLLFNPRRGNVKLAQLAIMLAEIDSVVKSCENNGEHCNVILCGDFNSLPHVPLYQLITTNEMYFQGLPAWMVSGQEDLSYKPSCYRLFSPLWSNSLGISDTCQYTSVNNGFEREKKKSGKYLYSHGFMLQLRYCPAARVRPQDLEMIPGVTDNTPDASGDAQQYDRFSQRFRKSLRHNLDLKSVYKHVLPGSGTPEVTTLHSGGGATVDYIFYSPKRTVSSKEKADGKFAGEGLKLLGSLSLLSEDVLWSMNGLPNHIFPSDHLSLVARFQLDFIS